jgi:DNA-directed RNA polymerase subunit RPC12/RpoP
MSKINERVHFRLIRMPCCGTLSCWVNHRLANYCPECGERVFAKLKTQGDYILVSDQHALLKYNNEGES